LQIPIATGRSLTIHTYSNLNRLVRAKELLNS
jgi:hypothetical protein